MPNLGKKLSDFTPVVTMIAAVAAGAAYLGHVDYAAALLVVLNAVWMVVYSLGKRSRAWFWAGILSLVVALLLAWAVLLRPTAEILVPDDVDRTTALSIKYKNVPDDKRLWLAIKGTEMYWPFGTCDKPSGSLIEQTKRQRTGTWSYPDIVIGNDRDAGGHFTLLVLLVEKSTDRLLAEEYRSNADACVGKPWAGMNLPAEGITTLTEKEVHRRVD
jgi:hypothetical protein